MKLIEVALGDHSYPVLVGPGLLANAAHRLRPLLRNNRAFVVYDEVVFSHLATLARGCEHAGLTVHSFAVPSGEGSKSWTQLAGLIDQLLDAKIERGEPVVALGGGVIGDLAGFAAALIKRGCPVVQIPTTLLAQVDSSVGGKTAINTAAGKNLVGVFHQPSLVLIDPATLATLPPRERRAGYAEVVKYGLIDDRLFFDWCEEHGTGVLAGDAEATAYAIAASVAAKARIVAADEFETRDIRALLNLGHTFGHALEAEGGFTDRLLHGEAVAAGMAIAFRLSAMLGLCPPADAERVTEHLGAVGLPTSAAGAGIEASGARLAGHMAHDKKRQGGVVPLILARGIGQAFVARDVQLDAVASFLDSDR